MSEPIVPEQRHVIEHVGLSVRNIARSRHFYERALEPLGFCVVWEFPAFPGVGFGLPGKPSFWLHPGAPSGPLHVGFHAVDRESVDAFHAAALAAGGAENEPPAVHADYHPTYYSALVLDPDGNKVEAVCRAAPKADSATVPGRGRPPLAS